MWVRVGGKRVQRAVQRFGTEDVADGIVEMHQLHRAAQQHPQPFAVEFGAVGNNVLPDPRLDRLGHDIGGGGGVQSVSCDPMDICRARIPVGLAPASAGVDKARPRLDADGSKPGQADFDRPAAEASMSRKTGVMAGAISG